MTESEKKETSADNPHGISTRGNALRRYWLIALGLAIVPMLLSFAYLLLVRENAVQQQTIQQAADNFAKQQAADIEHMFHLYKQRLEAASTSPLALAAISSRQPEDITLVEKAIMVYFPGVTSIRIFTIGELGTAGLESSNLGLRNHIEVDLLRRTGEGSATIPESYQFDGTWLTSLAALVTHHREDSKRAVILATFDNSVVVDTLAEVGTEWGHSALQQIYRKGNFTRADEIAVAGSAGDDTYTSSVELNGGHWVLVFSPSALMLGQLQIQTTPVIAVLIITTIAVLLAFLVLIFLYEKFLVADVERILASADKKSPLEMGVPQLLPLAKALRRATLRFSTRVGAGRNAKPLPNRDKAGGLSDPMFQKTNMIDEDEDDDFETSIVPTAKPVATRASGEFPSHIFRAYDIRGLAPSELSEELIVRIGGALGTLAGEVGQQALIVACDGRNTSPAIKNTLVKALLDSGRDVVDIGMVPTPLLYYATHTLSTQSGVMITGSHNPAEYNGLKITLKGAPLAAGELQNLRDRVVDGKFSEGAGRLVKQDVRNAYIEAIVGDVAIASTLKVVVDAGNGVAGAIAPHLLEELGCEVVPLYCNVDGDFPNHHPDPSIDSNLQDLQERVRAENADFGIAYDGDGDRLAVVSAEGNIIRTDKLLMLFAQDVVSRNPGADVVFDVKCSRHLTQLVSRYGGRPILWKTGHAFMRQKMLETGALLGGEFSGHIFFGERWYGFDDGMYASARLAEIVSGAGTDLTSLLSDFPDTESTPEIRIPISDEDKFALMEVLISKADFSPGKVNLLDGIRVDYNDGWGLLRASNTTPALIARFEAHDADSLERIMRQFREQLAIIAPNLKPGF